MKWKAVSWWWLVGMVVSVTRYSCPSLRPVTSVLITWPTADPFRLLVSTGSLQKETWLSKFIK